MIEAGNFAKERQARRIIVDDVEAAIGGRHDRNAWLEERTQETIREGVIAIDVKGEKVGCVNALTVMPIGFYAFGSPSRISARVYSGEEGVINIERATDLGGPLQQKGVMILEGFLNGLFGQNFPPSFSSSVTFCEY